MVEEQQHILGLSADAYLRALKPKENIEFHIRRLEQEMQLLVLGAHTLRPLKNKENNLAKKSLPVVTAKRQGGGSYLRRTLAALDKQMKEDQDLKRDFQ